MQTSMFYLALAASLAVEAVAQTTATVDGENEDDVSNTITAQASQTEDPLTCGYVSGDSDRAITCSPSSCALLYVSGRGGLQLGCCDDDDCFVPTTCIESGTASGRLTLACTDGSRSRCLTWTWPDLSARAYGCATSRATLTAETTTTTDEEVTSTVGGGPSEEPTVGGPPGDNDDHGGPGMGWEHDLSSRQRVGAGIGSGITGGLLLIFFGIFGCWRGPAWREPRPRTQ